MTSDDVLNNIDGQRCDSVTEVNPLHVVTLLLATTTEIHAVIIKYLIFSFIRKRTDQSQLV